MNYFDSEKKIVSYFRDSFASEKTLLSPQSNRTEHLIEVLLDKNSWANSSGKGDLPPDFYSSTQHLMMEVMRVDDHSFLGSKGRPVNPTNEHESILRRELESSGFIDKLPNLQDILCIGETGLPTKEDHCYKNYCEGFSRTVGKHISHVDDYKHHHPGFDLIFFIMDESSAYFETGSESNIGSLRQRLEIAGRLHLFWCDRTLLGNLKGSGVDYLVWFAPFKCIRAASAGKLSLPEVCILDLTQPYELFLEYEANHMVSSEL